MAVSRVIFLNLRFMVLIDVCDHWPIEEVDEGSGDKVGAEGEGGWEADDPEDSEWPTSGLEDLGYTVKWWVYYVIEQFGL